jgi:hypothetical protein
MVCPKCNLSYPETVTRCGCGFDFLTRRVVKTRLVDKPSSGWYAGAHLRNPFVNFSVIIGFGFALVAGVFGTVILNIGTQGLNYSNFSASIIFPLILTFVLANGFAGGLGLIPVLSCMGGRAWWFGFLGFVLGAAIAGLQTFTLLLLNLRYKTGLPLCHSCPPSLALLIEFFYFGLVLPALGGAFGVALARSSGAESSGI